MPRTAITPQRVTNGAAITTEAGNSLGHSVVQDGHRALMVVNGAGSPINVTLPTATVVDGDLAVADRVVAVPNGTTRFFDLTNPAYRQPDGTVWVDLSSVTSITVAVLDVP